MDTPVNVKLLLPPRQSRGNSHYIRTLTPSQAKFAKFGDPIFGRREYDKWIVYGQFKIANTLVVVGLDVLIESLLDDRAARA